MKRSVIETVLGAVVLCLAGFFLIFSYRTADVGKVSGYQVTAAFSGIGGLDEGDDVRISGVKVGSVGNVALDIKTFLAVVTMDIDPDVQLPEDTAAIISSESLLGGKYMELQPGASDEMLKPGGRIQYTQAPQNLEQLLGKFIFSMQETKKESSSAETTQDVTSEPALDDQAEKAGIPLLSEQPAMVEPAQPDSQQEPQEESQPEAQTEISQPPSEDNKKDEGEGADGEKGAPMPTTKEPKRPVPPPALEPADKEPAPSAQPDASSGNENPVEILVPHDFTTFEEPSPGAPPPGQVSDDQAHP